MSNSLLSPQRTADLWDGLGGGESLLRGDLCPYPMSAISWEHEARVRIAFLMPLWCTRHYDPLHSDAVRWLQIYIRLGLNCVFFFVSWPAVWEPSVLVFSLVYSFVYSFVLPLLSKTFPRCTAAHGTGVRRCFWLLHLVVESGSAPLGPFHCVWLKVTYVWWNKHSTTKLPS